MAEDARQHLHTLGLEPGASTADIKQAYRELAAVWHPDRYTNAPQLRETAQAKMTAINAAYQYLKTHDANTPGTNTASTSAGAAYRPTPSDRYAPPRTGASKPASATSDVPVLIEIHSLRAMSAPWEAVKSLAFSPDGGLILAAVGAFAIWWDAQSGRQVQGIRVEKGAADHIVVAPNGRYIAFANNLTGWMGSLRSEIRVCDLMTGHERQRFKQSGHVTSMAFSPDGKQLAAGTGEGVTRFWEADNGREIQVFTNQGEAGAIRRVAYVNGSQAAKQVATLKTGTVLSEITLWEVRRVRRLKEFTRHIRDCLTYGQIQDVVPSPDGSMLLVVNNDAGNRRFALHLWNVQTGEEQPTQQGFRGHTDNVICAAWSHDGKTIVSGSEDKTIRLWDAQTGIELARGTGHIRAVHALAFAPDGSRFVSGAEDGTARIWKRP